MGNSFETITVLQYRLKEAQEELAAFQSGEKYIRMEKQHLTQVRALERRIAKLEAAVAKEHSHAITIWNQWFEIFEQLQKECDRMVAEAVKKADMMEKRAIRAERQRDTALEKVTFQRRELYKVKTELDDEKQKVQKLTAQINRNYENSSIPSSKSIARKKISNSREKTGRKPGGQPGHRGHCRKKLTPTREIYLPAPEEVLHDPDFKKTSKTITKQKIDISVEVHVTGYHADVHYNSKTGERIHAPFPMNELAAIRAADMDIKIVLFRNHTLGLVHQIQSSAPYHGPFGVALDGSPDFETIAAAYRVPCIQVGDEDHLDEALDRFLGTQGSCLLICEVHPDVGTND